MVTLLDDLRSAWIVLARRKGYSLAAALTIAVASGYMGVAASVSAALLRPDAPAVADPSRVVAIYSTASGDPQPATIEDYQSARRRLSLFNGLAAIDRPERQLLRTDGVTHEVRAAAFFGDLENTLGFGEHSPRLPWPRAVLSHAARQRVFPSADDPTGRRLQLGIHEYVITHVAPEGFTGVEIGSDTDIWFEAELETDRLAARIHQLTIVGRMHDGVALDRVHAALNDAASPRPVRVVALADLDPAYRDAVRPIAIVLVIAGLMVVAAAASNLATLAMSNYATRSREFAIKESVGGTPSRLRRQLWFEGLTLAAAACVCGTVTALWSRQLVFAWFSPEQAALVTGRSGAAPPLIASAMVFLTCALVSVVCARFGCGLGWPLFGERRDDLSAAARAARPQRAVVVLQIACACTVLIGGVLLSAGMQQALRVGPGHLADRVAVVEAVAPTRYENVERGRRFQLAALEQARRAAGVTSAAWTSTLPLVSASRGGYAADGSVPMPYRTIVVSSDYFRTMAHQITEGREFTADDDRADRGVVIVNQSFAHRVFPGGALGREVRSEFGRHTIIGVAADARFRRFEEPVEATVFMPLSSRYLSGMHLVVRTNGAAQPRVAAIAGALRAIDDTEIRRETTLDSHLQSALRRDRVTTVVVFFAIALAMGFAIAGPYLLTHHAVVGRRSELAVRMALGARGGTLIGLVLKQALRATGRGIAGGVAVAAVMALASMSATRLTWPEVLITCVAAGMSVAAIALVAAVIPATAATRVHPVSSLR
jgi:putative ABC transport system permease protein